MSKAQKVEIDLGGRKFIFESGWMAKQASGSVMVTYGDTQVFVAATGGPEREGKDFFPLQIDYREKMAAAGRFPGGFIKREGRPTQKEILTARLTDRPLRPLFPDGFFHDLQVLLSVVSADQQNDPDVIGMNGASAALMVSDLPFDGPVGSVRVGLVGEEFILNPTSKELPDSKLDLVISGTKEGIIMVEAGAREVTEEQMLKSFEFAQAPIKALIDAQLKLKELAGKPLGEWTTHPFPEELFKKMRDSYAEEFRSVFFIKEKLERNGKFRAIRKKIAEELHEKDALGNPTAKSKIALNMALVRLEDEIVRAYAIDGKRSDGRGLKDIRPIEIQTNVLRRTHGSALFTRGETQALCMTTLGTSSDEQIVEGLDEAYSQRFMLHYNFPSFSVGETKPIRGPGRREIGHGALAERAIEAVLPSPEDFPYTIRVISDILESNGSSSMATVCGGCMALMDAGVPLKSPVAGIAMGLVEEGDKVAILTDILGSEDAHGDMDFKVAGTDRGITSLQMDLKAAGINMEVTKQALAQARDARLHVLGKMREAIAAPRTELSPHAPRLERIMIPPDKIGLLIGPGGKTIRELEARTGCKLEINSDDSGEVLVASSDAKALAQCRAIIEGMTQPLTVGALYPGRVVSLKDFGAFCEIGETGQDGLVHVSEITEARGIRVEDYLKVGMEVDIKMVSADDRGRNRFSIKAARSEKGLPQLEPVSGAGGPGPRPPARGGRPGEGRPGGGRPGGGRPGGDRSGGGESRFRDSRPAGQEARPRSDAPPPPRQNQ